MRRLENSVYRLMFIVAITVCCFLPVTRAQKTDPSEVKALRAIRRNLNDPMKNLNWTKEDPCMSNWNGVLCFNTTREDGFLHVRVLQLLNMNLSGSLAPELGQLSHMEILDFMWNKISGNIPKEIGKISSLKLLLLNGNELSGSLPEEIGNLSNLDRIQIDQNHISGSLPLSFAKLGKVKHFHMNNNSISGQIPVEYSQLPNILHILLDNNNLTGNLPAELSELPNLLILQLDNNNFSGASIPSSYGKMKKLLKLSLRNCSLQGPVPDLSEIPQFGYLDLSLNQLSGSIPTNKPSNNITTIDLSNNKLNGSIPSNYTGLPFLQKLSLRNNLLTGSVPSTIWQDVDLHPNGSLVLDFENNNLTAITGVLKPPPNVTIMLWGNPLCTGNMTQYCQPRTEGQITSTSTNSSVLCLKQSCPMDFFYEYNRASPIACSCAAPIRIGYRLKSPGFVDFNPYVTAFELYMTSSLNLRIFQLDIDSFVWEEGPRLRMYLKFFPSNSSLFNSSEVSQFRRVFTQWLVPDSDVFGPYEVLNVTLLGPYKDDNPQAPASSKLSKGALVGIIFGVIAIVTGLAIVSMLIVKRKIRNQHQLLLRKRKSPRLQIKIDGVKDFTFEEMSLATNGFSNALLVGQGGYGKVYKGILADGTEVAIKRAREGSLQGSKEFFTEIELLSRLHHRNLVSLLGYCDEQDEQMLVYEFMSNGTLRDHLSVKSRESLSFYLRLRLALDSAKGILYLHKEVDPPVIHRDIKATNILLDSKFIAKVADFGLSRLAPFLDVEGSEQGHVSTMVKGTPGYLDPEYFLTHKLTDKSDVYSLGVVFMELLTGMLPISYGKNIVREINTARQAGILHTVIDARMLSYPSECVERFLLLALKCCHEETDERPSMSEVVRELENIKLMVPAAYAAYSTPSDSIATDTSEVTSTDIFTPPSTADEHAYRSSNILGSDYTGGDLTTVRPR